MARPRVQRETKAAAPTAAPAARALLAQRSPATWPFPAPGFGPNARLQPKLDVSQPGDALEQEADRVAEAVTTSAPTSDVAARPLSISRATAAPAGPLPVSRQPGADVESSIARATRSGGGQPVPAGVRRDLESRFDEDLSDVRLHTDPDAAALAGDLDARAFTVGKDVFFAPGQLDTATPDGRRLLAHELTHVIQQRDAGPAAQAKLVQRAGGKAKQKDGDKDKPDEELDEDVFDGKKLGKIDKSPEDDLGKRPRMYLPSVGLPILTRGVVKGVESSEKWPKGVAGPGYEPMPDTAKSSWIFRGKSKRDDEESAAAHWRNTLKGLKGGKIREYVAAMVQESMNDDEMPEITNSRKERVFFIGLGKDPGGKSKGKGKGKAKARRKPDPSPFVIVGTEKELGDRHDILIPVWNDKGQVHRFDADHIHELELGGLDDYSNMWLWDRTANRSAGSKRHAAMMRDIKALLQAAEGPKGKKGLYDKGKAPQPEWVMARWDIHYATIEPFTPSGDPKVGWTREQIEGAEHLTWVHVLDGAEVAAVGIEHDRALKTFLVFPRKEGGFYKKLRREHFEGKDAAKTVFPGFNIKKVSLKEPATPPTEDEEVGTLTGTAFGHLSANKRAPLKRIPDIDLKLLHSDQLGLGVYLDDRNLKDALKEIKATPWSPIAIDAAGISEEGELFVDGRILAGKSIFNGIEVPIRIRGNEISVDFDLPVKSLNLGPLKVTDAVVRIFYGEKGFGLGGSIDFEVAGVGNGRIEAKGLDFKGWFELDVSFLDPARVEVAYDNETDSWKVDAKLKLKKGTLPGVESADVHVTWGPDGLTFDGEAVLDIYVLKGTKLAVSWNKTDGLIISADDIPLPLDKLPGITSASASIRVTRTPAGDWKVAGAGKAKVAFPETSPTVTGDIHVAVDGPCITIAGGVAVQKGFLKGGGTFVVTNKALDASGVPIEGPPREEYTAWGTGWAEVTFGKYLKGRVQITFEPDGSWKLAGKVGITSGIKLFERFPDESKREKDLFTLPDIDIFLFGIPKIVDVSIYFGAGVKLEAWVGPATLEKAEAEIAYDPDDEAATSIKGKARVEMPAFAGVKLYAEGGLKGSLPIVRAKIGLVGTFTLGLAANAYAETNVTWTPTKGFAIDAWAGVEIKPVLRLEGALKAHAWINLWVTTKNVYGPKTWPLAGIDIPSSIKFEPKVHLKWSEENGLDFDLDDVEFGKPDISLSRILSDLRSAIGL